MAAIDISSTAAPLNDGVLQLQNGVAMDSTLRSVTDQNNTASTLKLSTTSAQFTSPLRITTDDPSDFYLDCEDGSANNRFSITRNTASQQVNLNFASNPAGSTTTVGAIRTYVDGVNLSEVMSFREDGNVGIGTTAPTEKVHILGADNTNLLNVSGASGKLRIKGYLSSTYGTLLESTITAGTLMPMTFSASKILLLDGGVSINTTSNTAQLQIKGSGSTSATTALLVQNSAGNTSLQVTDDQQVTGYSGTQIRFKLGVTSLGQGVSTRDGEFAVGLLDASGASLRLLTTTTGFSYIDGYTEGAAKASNYPIVFGSRANNTGISVTGTTTQENGSQAIFGYAVNEASSLVTINSTTRGFLPPRMTNAQRAAITTPAIGLMVYCTDAVEGLYVYKSTGWTFVI